MFILDTFKTCVGISNYLTAKSKLSKSRQIINVFLLIEKLYPTETNAQLLLISMYIICMSLKA